MKNVTTETKVKHEHENNNVNSATEKGPFGTYQAFKIEAFK